MAALAMLRTTHVAQLSAPQAGEPGRCPDLQTHSSNGQAETLSPETGRHNAHGMLGLRREALTELGQTSRGSPTTASLPLPACFLHRLLSGETCRQDHPSSS